jgi:sulfoxide reductase heme-binding subunit YedZ
MRRLTLKHVPDPPVAAGVKPRPQVQRGYFYLGAGLLLAFFVQDAFALKWPWLASMQANEVYKQGTGFLLVLYVAHQWRLSWLRLNGCGQTKACCLRHKQWGAIAPVLYYFHSTVVGYAYLLFLSTAFFAIVLLGLCNREILGINSRWFQKGWVIVHVSLSVLLIVLMAYHGYVAFAYE